MIYEKLFYRLIDFLKNIKKENIFCKKDCFYFLEYGI